jgi:hypothetical protein
MKLNHKTKVKMARKMQSNEEKFKKIPLFDSSAWEKRKEAKAIKVAKVAKKKSK